MSTLPRVKFGAPPFDFDRRGRAEVPDAAIGGAGMRSASLYGLGTARKIAEEPRAGTLIRLMPSTDDGTTGVKGP